MIKKFFIALCLVLITRSAIAQNNIDTITANGGTVALNVAVASNTIHLTLTGTWTGTLAFEYLPYNSTTYAALTCTNETSFATATGATSNGNFACLNINFTTVRVRASAFSSGTANVAWRATSNGSLTGIIFGAGGGGTIGTVNQGTASATEQWLVNCVTGCAGGTTDTDDGSIAAGQTTSIPVALNYLYNGSAWVRAAGDATNGFKVQLTTAPTLTVTGSGGTFPVTQSTSPWIVAGGGTAGSAATGVVTVQGIASGTVIPISSTSTNTITAVLSGATGGGGASGTADAGNPVKIGGKYNSTPVTFTDGNRTDLQMDVNGYIKTNCATGCSGGTSDVDDGTIASGQTTGLSLGLNQVFDGTNWKRFTIGTAGTASAQVVTIQGIGSMTPILATVTGTATVSQATGTNLHMVCDSGCSSSTAPADNSAFTAGTTSSSPMSGFYQSTPSALTDGRVGAVGLSATRAMRTTLESAGGTPWVPSTDYTHDGALGTITSVTGPETMFRASAAAPTAVSADDDAVLGWALRNGSQVVNLAAGSTLITSTSTSLNTNVTNTVTVSGTVTANMGTVTADPFGANADAASATGSISAKLRFIASTGIPITGTVTVGSHAVTNAGTFAVQDSTTTLGCYLISAASTNATNCKGSAGSFYGVRLVNTTATLYYLRLYNLASAPTCSSATGFIETIPVPASTTGAGVVAMMNRPIPYGTGIGFCFTGGSSSTDNTNAATGVFGAVLYN